METVINKEYQKLIDKLDEAMKEGGIKRTLNLINEVKQALMHLGSRPVLSSEVEIFTDITTSMARTYAAKNHDYGNSFDKSLDKFGIIAGIVRMGDKMNRIESLAVKKAEVNDESIKDTLLDLATYSVMTLMWLNKVDKEE